VNIVLPLHHSLALPIEQTQMKKSDDLLSVDILSAISTGKVAVKSNGILELTIPRGVSVKEKETGL
jgi:hypothetical protein